MSFYSYLPHQKADSDPKKLTTLSPGMSISSYNGSHLLFTTSTYSCINAQNNWQEESTYYPASECTCNSKVVKFFLAVLISNTSFLHDQYSILRSYENKFYCAALCRMMLMILKRDLLLFDVFDEGNIACRRGLEVFTIFVYSRVSSLYECQCDEHYIYYLFFLFLGILGNNM